MRRRRTSPLLLAEVSLLLPLVACTTDPSPPPPTQDVTLATLGPQITLNATIASGRLDVDLGTPSLLIGQCVSTQAQATLNGQPMTVVSAGTGSTTKGFGDGPGCGGPGYTDQCTAPSFESPFDPTSTSDVDIRAFDGSATYVFHVQLVVPTVVLDSSDGLLHSGQMATLTLSPPPLDSDAVTIVFGSQAAPDASWSFVFSLLSYPGAEYANTVSPDGGSGTDYAPRTPTGIAFAVPPASPQPGVLRVGWDPASTTVECSGVSACALSYTPPAAMLATSLEN